LAGEKRGGYFMTFETVWLAVVSFGGDKKGVAAA